MVSECDRHIDDRPGRWGISVRVTRQSPRTSKLIPVRLLIQLRTCTASLPLYLVYRCYTKSSQSSEQTVKVGLGSALGLDRPSPAPPPWALGPGRAHSGRSNRAEPGRPAASRARHTPSADCHVTHTCSRPSRPSRHKHGASSPSTNVVPYIEESDPARMHPRCAAGPHVAGLREDRRGHLLAAVTQLVTHFYQSKEEVAFFLVRPASKSGGPKLARYSLRTRHPTCAFVAGPSMLATCACAVVRAQGRADSHIRTA